MTALRGVHAREEHAELLHVLVVGLVTGDDIMVLLAFHLWCGCILGMAFLLYRHAHVAFDTQFDGGVVCLAVEQRTIAVLLAVEVVLEREDIIGTVLIHRRVGIRANDEGCVGAVTNQDDGQHQHTRVEPAPEVFALVLSILDIRAFLGVDDRPDEQTYGQDEAYPHTCVKRTSEPVDEGQFEPSDKRREARNNTVEDNQQNETGSQECVDQAFPRERITTEVIYESDRRYRQEVQEVDTDTQTHQISDKDQPFVGSLFVRLFVPFEDEPEDHRCEQRGRSIYLAFDSREPERVAEGVREGTYGAGTQQGDAFPQFIRLHQFLRERRDRPEKEEDRERTRQCREGIDAHRYMRRVRGKEREEMAHEHKERCAGRVSNVQFPGAGDELTAVPEGSSGFHGQEIRHCRDDKHQPSAERIPQFEMFHFIVIFCY